MKLPKKFLFSGTKKTICKYGENKTQSPAGLYALDTDAEDPLAIHKFKHVGGNMPGYNNFCDIDRALQVITHVVAAFDENFDWQPDVAVGVKHGNACGASYGRINLATESTVDGDPTAIFGGVIMTNFEIEEVQAKKLRQHGMEEGKNRFLCVVAAPSFTKKAIDILLQKPGNCCLLVNEALGKLSKESLDDTWRFRYVRGGFLFQPNYTYILDLYDEELKKITDEVSKDQRQDLLLSWAIAGTSNSNTITLVKDKALIGNGVGQQDRVFSAQTAIQKAKRAGHDIAGAVAASDSFFPFDDGPKELVKAGVNLIFSTSGSIRDEEVVNFCKDNNTELWLLPDSKARGFYAH